MSAGWDWEPSVVIGCAALAIGYLVLVSRHPALLRGLVDGRSKREKSGRGTQECARHVYFFSGVLLLLLDLVSPIDLLADRYLFSAHIVQHFVLALVVPPLLIAGLPPIRLPSMQPAVSWLLGVGTMIFWHIPMFFNAALADDGLHIAQHLSFLVTGTIFWWPVMQRQLAPLTAISYLFSACLTCSILGASLTFARPGLYPGYLNPADSLGLLPLIRDGWGLDPKTDQQLGGLLMWVPGCFVYLSAILVIVARWYGMKERTA